MIDEYHAISEHKIKQETDEYTISMNKDKGEKLICIDEKMEIEGQSIKMEVDKNFASLVRNSSEI